MSTAENVSGVLHDMRGGPHFKGLLQVAEEVTLGLLAVAVSASKKREPGSDFSAAIALLSFWTVRLMRTACLFIA